MPKKGMVQPRRRDLVRIEWGMGSLSLVLLREPSLFGAVEESKVDTLPGNFKVIKESRCISRGEVCRIPERHAIVEFDGL